ncbi:MAG: leucine-rich repeat protein [Thermoguttaceae bacterium]|nr:leucine-rich repeat protein [Thermoguttaceae bacterium]
MVFLRYYGNNESFTIPKNIKKIGNDSSRKCVLIKSIVIPGSFRKIENRAFAHCSLLTLVGISEIVEEINNEAFIGRSSLTIYAWKGACVKQYALENGIDVEPLK